MTNGDHTCGESVSTPSSWWGLKEITVKFRRKDLIKKASLIFRGFSLLFSVIAIAVMLLNKHGAHLYFNNYDVYKYLFAAVIISGLYNAGYMVLTMFGKIFKKKTTLVGSIADQVVAHVLVSAASSAIPLTMWLRQSPEYTLMENPSFLRFCDSSAAAISMAFFSFLSLLLSAVCCSYALFLT